MSQAPDPSRQRQATLAMGTCPRGCGVCVMRLLLVTEAGKDGVG